MDERPQTRPGGARCVRRLVVVRALRGGATCSCTLFNELYKASTKRLYNKASETTNAPRNVFGISIHAKPIKKPL